MAQPCAAAVTVSARNCFPSFSRLSSPPRFTCHTTTRAQAVPLGAVPLGAVPLGAVPLGAVPLGAVPLGAVPLFFTRQPADGPPPPPRRQYHYVLQSLTLWREISTEMFKLWYLAESDMLREANSYRLVRG